MSDLPEGLGRLNLLIEDDPLGVDILDFAKLPVENLGGSSLTSQNSTIA